MGGSTAAGTPAATPDTAGAQVPTASGASGASGLRLVAAPFTAFDAGGGVDLGVVGEQARVLGAAGVDGAFVCGTTGEGVSLTVAERMALTERWVDASADVGLRLIVHVGHSCLADAVTLARHAADAGATAIAAVPPFFLRPQTVDELVDHCAELAAAAPGAAFFYYHIPHLTKVELPMAEFLAAAIDRIQNLGGLKFTHDDMLDFAACLELAGDDYEVFFGRDELLLGALAYGARAAVGSTYNFAAPLYHALAAALGTGDLDEARHLQGMARGMVRVAERYGGLPALKALAGTRGPALGPCRPPLRTLDGERVKRLVDALDELGFFAALDASAASPRR